jgi:hypothetical protein
MSKATIKEERAGTYYHRQAKEELAAFEAKVKERRKWENEKLKELRKTERKRRSWRGKD